MKNILSEIKNIIETVRGRIDQTERISSKTDYLKIGGE
jgi:hypothetical protein